MVVGRQVKKDVAFFVSSKQANLLFVHMCCSPSVVGLTAKVDRRKVPNPNLLRAILYSSKYTNINHRPLTEFSLLSLFVLEAMEAHVKLCKAKASCLANHNDRSRWRVRVFLHLYGMRLRKCENAHAVGP